MPASLPPAQSATPASPYAAAPSTNNSLPPAHRLARDANHPHPPPDGLPAPRSHRLLATSPVVPDCLPPPITPALPSLSAGRKTALPSGESEPAAHKLRRIDADGKAQPLRRQNGRSIHANHPPRGIHQRPARISRIQRRIGLNHIINQSPGIRPQRSSQRAHHSRRHGRLKSIRRSNRNRHLPHPQPLRIAQHRGGESRFTHKRLINPNHSQIARRIVANSSSRHAPPIGDSYFDTLHIVHHMAVSQNQPIRSKNKSRPTTPPLPLLARTTASGSVPRQR